MTIHAVLTCVLALATSSWGAGVGAGQGAPMGAPRAGRASDADPVLSTVPLECTSPEAEPQWPTYHFMNRVTRDDRGELRQTPLNDANAIIFFKGLFHIMMQEGGGNWTHAVAETAAGPWFHLPNALSSGPPGSAFPDKGPCDGSLSFPDLGSPPFDGSAPVIIYDADCGTPLGPNNGLLSDDVARLEVAWPVDPGSPELVAWRKSRPGPVAFDGEPCAFPSRVWQNGPHPAAVGPQALHRHLPTSAPEINASVQRTIKGGASGAPGHAGAGRASWSMLCEWNNGSSAEGAKGLDNGGRAWARYSTSDPGLMRWALADRTFTQPLAIGGYDHSSNGIMFHPIPNAPPGGPTHMINGQNPGPGPHTRGDAFWLGDYSGGAGPFVVDEARGPQRIESGPIYHWAIAGPGGGGRLLTVGWLENYANGDCRGQFGSCNDNVASLVRELSYDRAAGQLVSYPAREYSSLHNATFLRGSTRRPGVALDTLPVPASSGGALDLFVSFDLSAAGSAAASGFGLAVRAPPHTAAGAGLLLVFNVSAAGLDGARVVDPGWCHGCNRGDVPPVRVLRGETLDVRVLVDRPIVEVFLMGGRAAAVLGSGVGRGGTGPFNASLTAVHIVGAASGAGAAVVPTNVSAFGMACGFTLQQPRPPQ